MKAALARHDQIMRTCIESRGGFVFKTVGDAFCAAFETAVEGMNAALESQVALLAATWEVPGGIRVRMALHTGTAEERDGDYFGQTLNRVARLLSIGFGGQTLVSLVTAELLRDLLPDEVSLQDLGAHRLKDLLRPESVFQLVKTGLRADFPVLKSLDNRPHNLPLQPNPFVGREKDLESVQALLTNDQVRVLTLTGIGGTGKTRLSLQAAANLIDDYTDGVFFVDLSAIDSAAHVIPMIARTLEVRETGARPLKAALQDALRDKRMLLILDNFEQVIAGVPHVVDLLAGCPLLKLLVTSREALHIRAERVFRVPPLSVPKIREAKEMVPSRLSMYEAVSLFIERATAVAADFTVTNENAPAVAEICARLDGLPLAIELAAARVSILTPSAILGRLGSRLKLLSGGASDLPFRQRTMRATIDWSYRLLAPAEQMLFREAAVFSGGCTLDAMESICNCSGEEGIEVMEVLSSLVGKSMLFREEARGGAARFLMFESVREYGLELLEAGKATGDVRSAHARYFLARAEAAAPLLSGPRQKEELDALEAEHENFRSALDWLHEASDMESEMRLCAALGLYWQVRGYFAEGRAACERALWTAAGQTFTDSAASKILRARAGLYAGILASEQGHYPLALNILGSSLSTFESIRDEEHVCLVLIEMGMSFYRNGDEGKARQSFEKALEIARRISPVLHARAENGLGLVDDRIGQFEQARRHFETGIQMLSQLDDDRLRSRVLINLANVLSDMGDFRSALEICTQAAELSEHLGDTMYVAHAWNNKGFFHSLLGEHELAKQSYDALERIAVRIGNERLRALALAGKSEALLSLGSPGESLQVALSARVIAEKCGPGMELGTSLRVLGEAYLAQGSRHEARECFAKCLPLLEQYLKQESPQELVRARRGLAMSLPQ
jgi:predicted ATPase/Tfp pilus assembly protein PilF